jgi:acetyl-CoA C-acetyltransferase
VESSCATGNNAVRNALFGIVSGAIDIARVMDADKPGDLKATRQALRGVAQCVELFEQLRGTAANQVDGARVGLAHNIGGPTAV